MKKIFFFSILLLLDVRFSFAQSYVWTQKASMPSVLRGSPAGFSIDSNGYVTTGLNPSNAGLTDLWQWNQPTNTWTQKANFPGLGRYSATGFSIGTNGYLTTGWTSGLAQLQDLWEYNSINNVWTQKSNFGGIGRYTCTSFVIGGIAYVGMGYSPLHNDLWAYDPSLNAWTQKANLPSTSRQSAAGFSIGAYGYMACGHDGSNLNEFWQYDPALNIWVQKASFPGVPRYAPGAFVLNGLGFVGTGGNGSVFYNDFYSYDPATNLWTPIANLPGPGRRHSAYFNINVCGYISCGVVNGAYLNDLWEYGPVFPLSAIANANNVDCFGGNTGTATAIYSGGTAPYTYVWIPGGQSTAVASNLTAGTYTVTITDSNGFTATASVTVNQPPALVLTGPTQDSICNGSSISLIASAIGGTPPYVFTWNPGGFVGANYSVSPLVNTTYTVNIVDSNGCTVPSQSALIIVKPLPDANFNYSLDTCNLTALFTNQSLNSSTFHWHFGDGDSSNLFSPSHQYPDSGNYVITLYSDNDCGTDTIVQNIYIPGIPVADASFQFALDTCLKTVSLTNQSQSSSSYSWIFSDGTSSSAFNPVHTFADTGSYQITLVASNSCNSDSAIANIFIPDVPEAISTFSYTIDTCSQTISFNNLSSNASSFLWNFGDSSNSTNLNPIHNFIQPGVYQVSLIAYDFCGSDTSIFTVNVPPSVSPLSLFNFALDSCSLNVTFTNSSQNALTTQWFFGDNGTDTSFSSVHQYTDTGTYIVSLITHNLCGSDTLQLPLHIIHPPLPDADFSYLLDSCLGTLTLINNSMNASGYFWSFGNGDTSNLASPTVTFQDTGNYIITLTSFGPCEMDSVQQTVFIPLPPPVIADFTHLIDTCSNTVTFNNQSVNAVSYQWYFMDGDSSSISSPVHTFSLAGIYEVLLIATNSAGCSDSMVIEMELLNDTFGSIFIPNCFTPNKDGLNETFKIQTINNCIDYKLEIYNRWGQLIYATEDLTKEWDGRFSSKDVPEGVYFYLFSGKNISKKGSISVFR